MILFIFHTCGWMSCDPFQQILIGEGNRDDLCATKKLFEENVNG